MQRGPKVLQKWGDGGMQVHEIRPVGWRRSKWLRLYQTKRNLTSGDMVIPFVVIRPSVLD